MYAKRRIFVCQVATSEGELRRKPIRRSSEREAARRKGVRTTSSAILGNDVDLADIDLAAEVEVYNDPASALHTMAHNHPASQDVGLTPIQETSGKPHSPTLMDLDIQDRGYHLLRTPFPRTPVNRPVCSHLAPHY
jgi:hypothetical protein